MSFTSPLAGALWAVDHGLHPFPLKPNSKEPAFAGWQEWAKKADRITIETYGLGNPDCNWGYIPGLSDLTVLDVDMKNGKDGQSTMATWPLMPQTLTVRTPTGGMHFTFKGKTKRTLGKLGVGIDTISINSYVVCPGSTIDGFEYVITQECEPAEWFWLMGRIAAVTVEKEAVTPSNAIELDTDENRNAAIAYLENAPPCVDGDGEHGGEYLLQILMEVRDRGISKELARELVLDIYNPRCDPPWESEEDMRHFDAKFKNAYNYAKNGIGCKSPKATLRTAIADFADIPFEPETIAAIKAREKDIGEGIPTCRASSIIDADIPPRDWIVFGMALIGFLSVTAAPGGTGKSNLELLKLFAVVTGKHLLGPDYPIIKSGAAVYYNAEDSLDEMKRRVAALRVALKLPAEALHHLHLISGQDYPLTVASSDQGRAIINPKTVEKLVNTVICHKAVLLSCDPLVSMHRVSENVNEDMDQVAMAFKQIAHKAQCAVSVVHHTNKAAMRDNGEDSANAAHFRGASSLINAARIAHILTRMRNNEAPKFGLSADIYRSYFKIELAKANLSAPAEKACWFKTESIAIANGEKVGACQYAPLGLAVEFKKTEAKTSKKAEQKAAIRIYIRARIDFGEEKKRKDICTEAVKTHQPWAVQNEDQLNGRIDEAIFGEADIVRVIGKGRAVFLRRERVKPDGANLLL